MISSHQQLLAQLYQGKSLTRHQSHTLFSDIINGTMDSIVITALLIALKVKGETIEEISGAADALRAAAKLFPHSPQTPLIDIVGTGGDGFNTINISTTAALVASASGASVAKHGNRSVSSKSGSSDLLASLGINLTMPPSTAVTCLNTLKFCFLFAPHYHQGVKHVVPVRQALKTRTIFNILGPLINPANPDYMLLGVYTPELIKPIAETLKILGVKKAMVVNGSGLDEVAIHAKTDVAELNYGDINYYQLSPQDFGIPSSDISSIEGGLPEKNAQITENILKGKGKCSHNHAVAVNAGCALYLYGITSSIKQGTELALETISSGKTWSLVSKLANMGSDLTSNQGNQ